MRAFKTTSIIELHQGVIGLSAAQAAARARNLRPVAEGVFEIISPVQFKAGEMIRLDEPEKLVRGRLECLEMASSESADRKILGKTRGPSVKFRTEE